MRRAFVAGNWKMNGDLGQAQSLSAGIIQNCTNLDAIDIGVCPPSVYLTAVAEELKDQPILLGAQDLSRHDNGAHTGEVSGSMLRDIGCSIVLVGHSERRQDHAESNQMVAEKFKRAQECGVTPILCIGETQAQFESGQTHNVVSGQIKAVLELCGEQALSSVILAYEPVWAIGTGLTASPDQAQGVHEYIRELLSKAGAVAEDVRIIYGGSVNSNNAAELFAMADIDGGLIGGASLKIDDFVSICKAASN
jgi:triosephosphate isomerase